METDWETVLDPVGSNLKKVSIESIEDCLSQSLSELIDVKVNRLKITKLKFLDRGISHKSVEIELILTNEFKPFEIPESTEIENKNMGPAPK